MTPFDPAHLLDGEPAMVSQHRAAELLGVSERTLLRWRSQRRVVAAKTSRSRPGRVLFPRSALVALIKDLLQ